MKKQIKLLVYIILAISLIACGFVGVRRIQVEQNYKDVQIAVRYSDVIRMSVEGHRPIDTVLDDLKNQGVTTILVKETTVAGVDKDYNTLKGKSQIYLIDGAILKFTSPTEISNDIVADSRYIVSDNKDTVDRIIRAYKAKGLDNLGDILFNNGNYYLSIGDNSKALSNIGIGFDPVEMKMLTDKGFIVAPQVKNWDDATANDTAVDFLINDLDAIDNISAVYFADSQIPAISNDKFISYLQEHQIGFIEFTSSKQVGINKVIKKASDAGKNYNVVRLHTIEDQKFEKATPVDILERYELALRERSNRVFLFKMPNTIDIDDDIDFLNRTISEFKTMAENNGYTITGEVPNYNLPSIPTVVAILAGLGAIMIFILLLDNIGFTKLGYVLGIIGAIGYIGLLKLQPTLACGLMALFSSIMYPSYAVVKLVDEKKRNLWQSSLRLIEICLVSFGGALTIIGCISRTNFALTINVFMGVKIAMVMPIVIVLGWFIYRKHKLDLKYYNGMLNKTITYKALVVIAVLGAVALVYVSRTGNTGTASNFERSFRQLLDNILGVRPRTKEFLFAYPILLALIYFGYKEKYLIILALGTIGPVSLVNTYAHIHTPVMISLIRSAYGIVFGIILGIVLIGIIKLIDKVVVKWKNILTT